MYLDLGLLAVVVLLVCFLLFRFRLLGRKRNTEKKKEETLPAYTCSICGDMDCVCHQDGDDAGAHRDA